MVVSAVDPAAFGPCVAAGADMLELGNFDAFYAAGLRLTSLDILDMTQRTQALHPSLPLSVTVPHWLQMEEQAQLAHSLQGLGVDVIQTEGSPSVTNLRLVWALHHRPFDRFPAQSINEKSPFPTQCEQPGPAVADRARGPRPGRLVRPGPRRPQGLGHGLLG